MSTVHASENWKQRIYLPTYRVGEAARYARTAPQTVWSWHRARGNKAGVLSAREHGAALSYMQLIEVGVVAAMRQAGVTLPRIRQARAFLSDKLDSHFPFAEYRFKTDGKKLFMDYEQISQKGGKGKLLSLNEDGQLAWTEILSQRLKEFEYGSGDEATVMRWKVAGIESPVEIDPRVAFGAPQVEGIPTWILRERWTSGEGLKDIAEDFDLEPQLVSSALRFEGIAIDPERRNQWVH
jgi:uncharacterized protein (DUF433 family)